MTTPPPPSGGPLPADQPPGRPSPPGPSSGAPSTPPPAVPPPGGPAPGSPVQAPERPGLDDRERPLDPKVIQVWRLMATFGVLLPTFALSVPAGLIFGRWGWLVPGAGLVLLVVLVGWYPPARYRRWRWRLTPLALELRHGVVVHQHESVPYFRIQQIDVAQGPLDRLLQLATLQVTTASASGSAALPGIAAEQAPVVRAELLARAADAVGEHEGEISDAV